MSPFESTRFARHASDSIRLVAALCFLILPVSSPGVCNDCIEVKPTAFDDFLDKLQPIPFSGTLQKLGFSCNFSGSVKGMKTTITTNDGIVINGAVDFDWCLDLGFDFKGKVKAKGHLSVINAGRTVKFSFTSASVTPCFGYLGAEACLPFSINVAPSLNVPTFPVGSAWIRVGSTSVLMNADVSVAELNASAEVRGDVEIP